MSIFGKFFKNEKTTKKVERHKPDTQIKPESVKPKKKIYYQEEVLDKQEFYFDSSTRNNKNQQPHASLQIGTGDGNWSRLPTTTAKTHDKSQYIYLKNPSKDGKQIKMRRRIITGSINKRLNKAKNRSKLEYSDMKKIKAFINKELEKNK